LSANFDDNVIFGRKKCARKVGEKSRCGIKVYRGVGP